MISSGVMFIGNSRRPITIEVKKEVAVARDLDVQIELATDGERIAEDKETYEIESD